MKSRNLILENVLLEQNELLNHLEKIASMYNVKQKTKKNTFPIPRMLENYNVIKSVYNLLNENVKANISIHPAGEWVLDNFYIIEEIVKQIKKELTLKKYINFSGISTGKYQGFARIYVLASEIVNYSDNKITRDLIEKCMISYQTKKSLSMDEIWNMGIFLEIAIIENIRGICEKIYTSQFEKIKAESIIERLVENKSKTEQKFLSFRKEKNIKIQMYDVKYPFVEYLSYKLKKYGKKTESFLKILEEEVEKKGITVSEIIKKEHFELAINKISMGNCILSLKKMQRINFLSIFEKINGVEEILKKDPAKIYEKMDFKTKENYRNTIKEIAKRTKISEMYIAKKLLELAEIAERESIKSHIGYYLQNENINDLYAELGIKEKKIIKNTEKVKIYISTILICSFLISFLFNKYNPQNINNMWIKCINFFVLLIPISEFVIQIIQYILGKIIKPKIIPSLDFKSGIPKEEACFIIIPTIVDNSNKIKLMFKNLEVDYLANKSKNLYFCLIGDCKESKNQFENYDNEVIRSGILEAEKLNKKYPNEEFPIFHFIYRKRVWNKVQNSYLGWERKRGAILDFTRFLLGNLKNDEIQKKFNINTISEAKEKIPKIKYIITLDSDTNLTLNSGIELVGTMAHILNKPQIENGRVIKGYGIIQPRVGVDLDISYKSYFTMLFAGYGGIDSYSNAISDIYQDNFGEGIFTGKGIFNLEVFEKILKDEIPENIVLSHDLLEGNYLRCGLASDILLMDGYPSSYSSFSMRLSRWIRGDWQIIGWLKNRKLNLLSKYKIFDNLRRSVLEISELCAILYFFLIEKIFMKKQTIAIGTIFFICNLPYILEILNNIILKRDREHKQKAFTPKIDGNLGSIVRAIISFSVLPFKAYLSLKAIIKTIYRLTVSKRNLLEWMTSEEAEKNSKNDLLSYFKLLKFNVFFGILTFIYFFIEKRFFLTNIVLLYFVSPILMYYISKEVVDDMSKEKLNKEEKDYILNVAKRTFDFFKDNITKENNFLIPDNYQLERKNLYVNRTSSTNIGLSLLTVISGVDLNFITKEEGNLLINNIINTIDSMKKWHGHLFNWYNTKTLEPLIPKYVSTVDSGNFVGYLYVTLNFLEEQNKENLKNLIFKIKNLINNTDFSKLYSKDHKLFSIGFNIEENKLTDSYYDLLASEARQASLIAIAKRDIEEKHWNCLSRTLTILNNKKGLISWSGTAFEYLMPNINMPRYKGSLIDESIKFAEMCQIQYAKKLGTPWGISESAFNVKDLHSNYQYKAFGIPWLGLKRGLADEVVISSYASVLSIIDKPKEVIKNLKELEKYGMYNNYGFYESIDFSPQRLKKDMNKNLVKTYMAHHQALILLSLNNLLNNNIFQKRFMANSEIQAVAILLQERMPEKYIVTKEEKEKPEKLVYKEYNNYFTLNYNKIDERLIRSNILSNGSYTIAINQKAIGFSKLGEIYINRFKETNDYNQGIFLYLKNYNTKEIIRVGENSNVFFMPDKCVFENRFGYLKVKLTVILDQENAVEIRSVEIENFGNREETLEVSAMFEPILSKMEQDIAHPAFNNLFLLSNYDTENDVLEIKRKKRGQKERDIYLETMLWTDAETIGDNEFDIDREKIQIRGDLGLPQSIEKSVPFSKKIGFSVDTVVAMRKTIKIKGGKKQFINLILSVNEEKNVAIENIKVYKNLESIKRLFEIGKAKAETESRYLDIKEEEFELYQKVLGYFLFENKIRPKQIKKLNKSYYMQSELWKYGISGDLKILLAKIKDINDVIIIKQILKMYEFFRSKDIQIDLVFLDEENHSYENYVREEIESQISDRHLTYLKDIKGGIFVLSKNEISKKTIELLNFISSFTVDTHKGDISHLISDLEEEYLNGIINIPDEDEKKCIKNDCSQNQNDILINKDTKYYNDYGAFSLDGKEYIMTLNKNKKLPTVWSNILANEKFGTIVTENMGGYTWHRNCRLNRISAWQNQAFMDIPSEIIYMKDLNYGKKWSLGLTPMPDENDYNIIYGFGYAKYIHESQGIKQELEVFVPNEDEIKVNILKLTNNTIERKKIKIIYYIKQVLGEDESKTNGNLKIDFEENSNTVFAENLYVSEFSSKAYVTSSEKIISFTGDKSSFIGNGSLQNPEGLGKIRLNNNNGFGMQNCIAIHIEVELESLGTKEITLSLGACEKSINGKNIAYKYSKINNCRQELNLVKKRWKDELEKIQIYTPIESINIMLNGWVLYQTISSRLLGKTGYYQSGGAFGFRDQLQDTLCLKYVNPLKMKEEILKHSKHQFIEGDVEHWWHEETSRGIRTRFSDDLLWLVFLTEEYIESTGDKEILNIETPYLQGNILKENEEEKYDIYKESVIKDTLYNHCIKAIKKSLNFGEHNLPKIGTGDWNDGFSEVGNKGKGESVWLGFFMYNVIQRFLPFIKERMEHDLYNSFNGIIAKLKQALNREGWDGRWYRRAFTDDNKILGSIENKECKIDSIAQSWAVISNAGEKDKENIAMESLENHLVDNQNGIIKLLDPPFTDGKINPGYIKAYLPGVRENGGQYTHVYCSCGQFLANMLEIKANKENVHNNNTPIKY